ncbi:hypothetical protein [Asinibacterium sp. OR53]|uniref:hypothetical protein n=1 Tax=Asinibacterium sp. OR53 TaxID=925409 RepID=UPI00047C5EB2|nr:hypothetical protein [Asinibacterium sp. OR53]
MKHYLELTDANNRACFIAAEDISALHENGNMCVITVIGVPTTFTVRKSPYEVIKKMIEIGLFELVKFS